MTVWNTNFRLFIRHIERSESEVEISEISQSIKNICKIF